MAGTLLSFVAEVGWMLLGFVFFTAKDSDVPWYYPVGEFITVSLLLNVVGLLLTVIVGIIQEREDY